MTKQVGNLPAELSSFVDRGEERIEIKRLVSTSRLVTVTGVGGVGKTRMTLRVATEIRTGFADGAWLVDLSSLQDGTLLPEVVAEGLGLRNHTPRRPAAVLAEYLAPQRMLLLLDGCEHLVDACAALVHTLLRTAPGLRVLVTSRQALGVSGEHLFPLSPLPVPPEGGWPPTSYSGVELFLERAQAVERRFELTEVNRPAVERLCRRLDGIPLAIELAAGRLRALSVQEIVSRLDDRFLLLTGGGRGRPARHATLRTAIDWSYQLCSPGEQLLWARASVFLRDFDLVAAQEVCADDELPAGALLDLVSGLVEKSILLRKDHPSGTRYRLLDTLREYGQWWLRESGDEPRQRVRHRDHYLRMARRCAAEWCGPDQVAWYEWMTVEQGNVRAALDFCLAEPGEHHAALAFVAALTPFWIACGSLGEARHYLERALALDHEPGPLLTRTLLMCAWLTVSQGDIAEVERRLAQCRPYAEEPAAAGWIAFVSGTLALSRGDLTEAMAQSRRAVELHRNGGDILLGLLVALTQQGIVLSLADEPDQVIALVGQVRELCDQYGEQWLRSYADYFRAVAELRRGELDAAVTHAREALRFKRRLRDSLGIVMLVEHLAAADVAQGGAERAARLLGSAKRLWPMVGRSRANTPALAASHDHCERTARERLGERAYRAAFRTGASLDLDAAVAYALDERQPAATPPTADWAPLTRREHEVAEYVAQGLTNQEIATRLVISTRTADSHVHHILTKLGFTNRAQVATWVAERRPGRTTE